MYIDYYPLEPGGRGEPMATSAQGETVAVRGSAGLGRVVASGIFNLETDRGTYNTLPAKLYGLNAELVEEALFYLTGVRPVTKDEAEDCADDAVNPRPVPTARNEETVWSGRRVVAGPLTDEGKALRLCPGTEVVFKDRGSVCVRGGDFIADEADLSADSTLTNRFRVLVENGRVFMRKCRVSGFETVRPIKDQPWVIGSIYGLASSGSRVEGCAFSESAAVGFVVSDHVTVRGNGFREGSSGVFLFHVDDCRVTRNVFHGVAEPIRLNEVRRSVEEKNEGAAR